MCIPYPTNKKSDAKVCVACHMGVYSEVCLLTLDAESAQDNSVANKSRKEWYNKLFKFKEQKEDIFSSRTI